MSGDKKRNRGLTSLAVAGLVGILVVGCSAAPAAKAQPGSPPQVREGRLVGDPYQAGGRSQSAQTPVNVRQLTGTHPGGAGPQE
jgi:hypothetical protein